MEQSLGLLWGYALLCISAVLDVLMVVYLFVGRTIGRVVYGAAIAIGVTTVWLIGPRGFWEFANPIDADWLLRLIPLSLLFVLAAPWLKAKILRPRQSPPQ